ncbi:MAG TPA: glycosyltransferase family 4 protein [bacterium]|nr:glycosyltransferase family 4 protein [bacterium]
MRNRAELIFWFETPPKVSKGAFNYVSRNWGNKVFYICRRDLSQERKATKWDDGDFGDAEVIMLSQHPDPDVIVEKIFNAHPNAIHIVAGFDIPMTRQIKKYILKKDMNVAVFCERPDMMGGAIERLARSMYFKYKYSKLRRLFDPYVEVFLPLGMKGVNTFASYGWDRKKMYPFMYNPIIKKKNASSIDEKMHEGPIRFLYVGRFYYKTKGIDTLMKACQMLAGDWKLDLVGGYGKDREGVLNWAKGQEKVEFLGVWPSEEVCNNIMNYDVVVVPAKYEGWNMLPNEAIHAGVGVIITEEATSDELIASSGAGVVLPYNDPRALAKAMQSVIDKPELAQTWKKKASSFIDRISSPVVGEYFMDVLDCTFYYNGREKPKCPWL